MPDPTATEPKTRKAAPPRNNLASSVLTKNSRALDLQGRDSEFVYEYKSTDPDSPAYIGKVLREHERGGELSGYAVIGPWEVVHSQTDKEVRALDPRQDQGKPVDTTVRYGAKQILCRIRKDEHAKYGAVEHSYRQALRKQIMEPDRLADGNTRLTSIVSEDENADKYELLKSHGHSVPGA